MPLPPVLEQWFGDGRPNRRPLAIALCAGVVLIVAASVGVFLVIPSRDSDTRDAGLSADPGFPVTWEPIDGTSSSGTSAGPTSAAAQPPAGGCSFAISGGVCPGAPPIPATGGRSWNITFAEEFSGTSYDPAKLTPCFDWNAGDCTSSFNNGREHYLPSQVVVSDGTAKLIAAPLNPPYYNHACYNGTCDYKAGLLSTARPRESGSKYNYSFTYGYVESRLKFPATQGFFTAFWMLPADPTFSYRSEIDILEMLGDDPTTMYMIYHYGDREQFYRVNSGKFHNGSCATRDYSTDFVRLGLDWEPDHIAWYINGKECARFSDAESIESGPMQLLLHMMVENDWQRLWNVGLTDTTLVRQLEVDYIRVYQQA